MTAVLFVGPSLARDDLADLKDFEILPPVAQGDMYAAATSVPKAIGIIDGYFHGVPAVWHKEILWAMDQGIHVFGGASMGALRAAELHTFGMHGIGIIFERYRDGLLTDDDEVAVLHGPREAGFVTVTEPMVNVRATITAAVETELLSRDQGDRILELAKAQYYQERTWDSLLAALKTDAPDIPFDDLQQWLDRGRVDQKRIDALELVGAMREFLGTGPDPMTVEYRFEVTEMWAGAPWNDAAGQGAPTDASADREDESVLDELRLESDNWFALQARALEATLERGEIELTSVSVDRDAVMAELNAFRQQHGLVRRSDIETWAAGEGMDLAGVEQMMTEQAQRRRLVRNDPDRFNRLILERLKQDTDEFERLSRRARHKAEVLETGDVSEMPGTLSDHVLFEWYFHNRLERGVPERLGDFAGDLGLAGREQFAALLQDEAVYLKILSETDGR